MKLRTIRNFAILLPLALGMAACASTGFDAAEQQATHAWYAKEAKTERDYKLDQAQCSEAHEIATTEPMAKDSLSFEGYHNCMLTKGYVLRTY